MMWKKNHTSNSREKLWMDVAVWAILAMFTLPLAPAVAQESGNKVVSEALRHKIQYLSSAPMFLAAEELGITEIMGKNLISGYSGPTGNAKAKKLRDVGIGIGPSSENEPTVVANPKDKKKLVAGAHRYGIPSDPKLRCVAYTSTDGGQTWSAPTSMPGLIASSQFSDPVLAYAPDGSRVYYAYMDIKPISLGGWDIVVSYSDDDGQTWTGPFIALDGLPAFVYDKPWVGTHLDQSQSNWVYVTATQFTNIGTSDYIAFARSGDKGATWSSSQTLLDAAPYTTPMVVQGSRPTGGVGGDVLVAWYNSTMDGWLSGGFEIRTAYSADNGATFSAPVVAAADNFECPYWLGPGSFYHRFWGSMFPDVEIDPSGGAHIVYTHDPVAGSATAEEGDIRYVGSAGPPYGSWSAPVTVNDDGMARAQGYAALKVGNGGQLHAIWEDHRLSPEVPISFPNSPNLYYDIFYSRNTPGKGSGWFKNFRVSESSSINDFVFIGDYNDLAVNNTTVFAIWTDRRHQTSIFPDEDNVFGSRIIAGGGLGKLAELATDEAPAANAEGQNAGLPVETGIVLNYPNPFNPSTTIRYAIAKEDFVTLKVYNSVGAEVAVLVNEVRPAGVHSVGFDASGLASGLYFYRFQAGGVVDTRRMVFIK